LRLCILRVLWWSVCFCTGHFVMVPINLTCSHCLQHLYAPEWWHIVIDSSVRPHGSCALHVSSMRSICLWIFKSVAWFLSYALNKIQCTRTIAKRSFILLELLPFVNFHSWILSNLECNCMNLGIILLE